MSDAKTCPVDGCESPIEAEDHILCRAHWEKLDAAQRDEIVQAYWAWQRTKPQFKFRTRNDYTLLCNNAIKAAGRAPEDPADEPA